MNYYNKIKKHIKPFIKEICNKEGKALENIIFNFTGCLCGSNFSINEIDIYKKKYFKDSIFNIKYLFSGIDNIFDAVDPKYKELARLLFACRPFGFGTPNAAIGEGEFMMFMLSPRIQISKKSKKGDLIIDGKNFEIKGDAPRLYGSISGKEMKKIGDRLGKKYKMQPNNTKCGVAFEPWDKSEKKNQHWINEFSKHSLKTNVEFLYEYMYEAKFNIPKEIIKLCFKKNIFDCKYFIDEILKALSKSYIETERWDYFTHINKKLKVITFKRDYETFISLIESKKIVAGGNFFRLNQERKIAWYLEFK